MAKKKLAAKSPKPSKKKKKASRGGKKAVAGAATHAAILAEMKTQYIGEVQSMPMSPAIAYARAEMAYLRYRDELKSIAGVRSVSLGWRFVGGASTGEFAVRVRVDDIDQKHRLRNDAVAGLNALRRDYDGVPIDILAGIFKNSVGEDGSEIRSGGGRGSLGVTVTGGTATNPRAFWLTAQHVIGSKSPTSTVQNVSDGAGNTIGFVPPSTAFQQRDPLVDGALIVPSISVAPGFSRSARIVTANDIATFRRVTMPRSANGANIDLGVVDSIRHTPIPLQDGSLVVDHIFVAADKANSNTRPAVPADSGAPVFIGSDLIGIVRASDVGGRSTAIVPIFRVLAALGARL